MGKSNEHTAEHGEPVVINPESGTPVLQPATVDPAAKADPAATVNASIFRCYCCGGPDGIPGKDFTVKHGDKIECPTCGTEKAWPTDGMIVPVEVIHYEALKIGKLGPLNGQGVGFIACNPAGKVGTGGYRASGDVRIVNCPACLASASGKTAAKVPFNTRHDFTIDENHFQ